MALVPCAECGGQVSTLATGCPHCGAPTQAHRQPSAEVRPFNWGPLAIVGGLVVIAVLAIGGGQSSGPAQPVLTPVRDDAVISAARDQVLSAGYACTTLDQAWSVATNTAAMKILKLSCPEAVYQLTLVDDKGFVKPWTGTLLGN